MLIGRIFHAKKTIGVHPNIQNCHVYIHTVGITGVGYPHCCFNVLKIELCDSFWFLTGLKFAPPSRQLKSQESFRLECI